MNYADKELIDQTIRTNLALIKAINRNPYTDGLVFRKELLIKGIETLGKKSELDFVERNNLIRFNEKWSLEESCQTKK